MRGPLIRKHRRIRTGGAAISTCDADELVKAEHAEPPATRSSLSINRLAIEPCLKILRPIADAAH